MSMDSYVQGEGKGKKGEMDNSLKYFAELRDRERNGEHVLEEILLIAIAAVLNWAESWNDIDFALRMRLAKPAGLAGY